MSNDDDSTEEKSVPWTLLIAGLIVALIVAMGVVLSVRGLMGDDEEAAPPPSSSSSSSTQPEGDAKSVCGLPGHETSGTVNRAPDAEWRLIGSIAAPHVEKVGPGKIDDDGFGYCYAHTPEGAVVAAANVFPQSSISKFQAKTYDKQLVPGPGRDVAMKAVEDGTAEGIPSDERLQIAGFRLSRYTGDEAEVEVVTASEGRYFTGPIRLQWSGGDWKMIVNDDGSLSGESTEIPDLSGYIAWSGA